MAVIRTFEGIAFYLSIFLISIQLGKHFWPEYAFVNGIRLDYLSPTIYLSDISILLFIAFHIVSHINAFYRIISKSFVLPLFLISLLFSSYFAQNFEASIYWSLKLIEIVFFSLCVANYSFNKILLRRLINVLVVASLVQSVIVLIQFGLQRSVGGALYFLGERTFSLSTIGISTFVANGQEILRPYGTFPHPNVLAFFLSMVFLFVVSGILSEKKSKFVYFYIASLIPVLVALLITASRVIIFLTLIIAVFSFLRSKKFLLYSLITIMAIFPFYIVLFSGRFLALDSLASSIMIRLEFINLGIKILQENLLFGVGLNNTFLESSFRNLPIYARFQPIHNIYLHLLLQIGLFGAIPVSIFVYKALKRALLLVKDRKFPAYIIALLTIEIFTVGLLDHFIITLQQGLIMGGLVLGLLFNRSMEQV